jgi:Protein of unknown function (DUF3126)
LPANVPDIQIWPIWEPSVKPEELRKLDAYFKRVFATPGLEVRARPRKADSAELYRDDEFLGVIYRDDEDGELSYNFSMAILDIDLDV